MKKTVVSILIAAFVVSLLIPAAAVTASAKGAVIEVKTEAEFIDALNKDTSVAAIDITSGFTVTKDCTVQFDAQHINYYCDVVVTIKEGVTLTVCDGGAIGTYWPSFEGDWETPPVPNGRMVNNGTVIVEDGGWIEASFEENNGTIIVKDGAVAMCCSVNNGTVIVEYNGMYLTPQGNKCVNNGTIRVNDEALMISRFGCTIENSESGVIELDGEFMCGVLGFDDGVMLFKNNGTVTGHGMVTLDYMGPEDIPMPDMDAMIERMMAELGQKTRFDNWYDISIYKQYEVTCYEDMTPYINEDRTVAGEHVDGNMDTIFYVIGELEIPENDYIETMAVIIVAEGASLTVNAGAYLECAMTNNSKVEVMPGASLATSMGDAIINLGTLYVHEGAELISQMGSFIINDDNAEITLDGTFICGCIGDGVRDILWFYNFGTVKGDGSVLLYEAAHNDLPVSDMDALMSYAEEQVSGSSVSVGLYWVPGDINGDFEVDNKDIVTLFRYVSGGKDIYVNVTALDTNGDGLVDNKDIVTLFRFVSGGGVTLSDKPYTIVK